jgi:hypothetical protein
VRLVFVVGCVVGLFALQVPPLIVPVLCGLVILLLFAPFFFALRADESALFVGGDFGLSEFLTTEFCWHTGIRTLAKGPLRRLFLL